MGKCDCQYMYTKYRMGLCLAEKLDVILLNWLNMMINIPQPISTWNQP